MESSTSRTSHALVCRPVGRVDELSWEAFHAALSAAIGEAAALGLPFVVDMAEIPYMSSRGLRVLTLARREAEAKSIAMRLARPGERMREILAISRYDKIFEIDDAIAD